jgi:5'-3' exonuclease
MEIHLVDGTYELFRHFYAVPTHTDLLQRERGATIGVVASILAMLRDGATHVGVATDHVIESFRNGMYPEYKTGDGIEPALFSQFHPLEEALRALGVTVWPMIEQEADDALAAAAHRADGDESVERVLVCSPDKDLAQCVRGSRVVQFDRRRRTIRNESGVIEKFGVLPTSIPDYLALVGDTADGFPGLPRWGAKSAGLILGRYRHLEDIPENPGDWRVDVRSAPKLAKILREQWEQALLFRDLATLRTDAPVFDRVDELRWNGPTSKFASLCAELRAEDLAERAEELVAR